MKEDLYSLTPSEWLLMECLWENAPCTGREAVEDLRLRAGWSRSTTLTILRRMTEKGFIACNEDGTVLQYSPLIEREDAVQRETGNFLNRVYNGSVSLLVSAMAKEQKLTKDELEELREILRRAEDTQK